ncbi:MAG TPA: hypothetical protein VMV86_00090, partial [Methanosarcinales archaeon]|nr:hypothetical protein [Methanosarcinales archaeon]
DHGYEPDHLAVQGFITRLKQMQYAVKTGGSDKLSEVIERVNSGKVLPPTKQISQKDATAKTQSLTQVLPKPPPIQGVIDRPEKNIPPNPEGMKKLQEAERAQSAARRAEIQAKRKKIAPIEKGALKTGLATLAAAATIASGPSAEARPVKDFAAESPKQEIVAQKPQDANKQRILDAISSTESAGGRNTKHERLPASGIHRGESAYGAYGLTPLLIRETAKMNPDIMKEHPDLHKLKGSRLHRYMAQNPNLEHKIASKHYDRLASHFGHDVDKIAHSWLNGITGTKKSLKQGNDIQNHWHVKKVRKAYGKR